MTTPLCLGDRHPCVDGKPLTCARFHACAFFSYVRETGTLVNPIFHQADFTRHVKREHITRSIAELTVHMWHGWLNCLQDRHSGPLHGWAGDSDSIRCGGVQSQGSCGTASRHRVLLLLRTRPENPGMAERVVVDTSCNASMSVLTGAHTRRIRAYLCHARVCARAHALADLVRHRHMG